MVEAKFYMEYRESKKAIEEMYDAYYKYKESRKWKIFRSADMREKVRSKTDDRYQEIRKTSRKDRTVKVEYFDDHFVCTVGDVISEYRYDEIEKICETDTTLMFIAGRNRKKDAYVGLKKGSLRGKGLSELKKFLLERCTKLTDGIEVL